MKRILTLLFLSVFCYFPLFSSPQQPNNRERIEIVEPNRTNQSIIKVWQKEDRIPDRVSFSTRAGYVLLRKEQILFLTVDSKYGGIHLHYEIDGVVKKVFCKTNLTNALEKLGSFPFVKVSRSNVVNLDKVALLEGTRREAKLVMSDGSNIKLSRDKIGLVCDWMESL